MFATTKAVVELFILADSEGWAVFCVKRAQCLVIFARFFKGDSGGYDINDIDPV